MKILIERERERGEKDRNEKREGCERVSVCETESKKTRVREKTESHVWFFG